MWASHQLFAWGEAFITCLLYDKGTASHLIAIDARQPPGEVTVPPPLLEHLASEHLQFVSGNQVATTSRFVLFYLVWFEDRVSCSPGYLQIHCIIRMTLNFWCFCLHLPSACVCTSPCHAWFYVVLAVEPRASYVLGNLFTNSATPLAFGLFFNQGSCWHSSFYFE